MPVFKMTCCKKVTSQISPKSHSLLTNSNMKWPIIIITNTEIKRKLKALLAKGHNLGQSVSSAGSKVAVGDVIIAPTSIT